MELYKNCIHYNQCSNWEAFKGCDEYCEDLSLNNVEELKTYHITVLQTFKCEASDEYEAINMLHHDYKHDKITIEDFDITNIEVEGD